MRSNSPWLLGIGLAVTAGFAAVIGWARFKRVEVLTVGYWSEPVAICASATMERGRLAEALGFWAELGHPVHLGCNGAKVTIIEDPTVDLRDSVEDLAIHHGVTVTTVDAYEQILSAKIRVLPNSSSLVLAHEVGHALGYVHPKFAPSGHMMHPHNPGWDDRGLEYQP